MLYATTAANGSILSITSEVDPSTPPGMVVVEITEDDAESLRSGTGRWDAETRSVKPIIPPPLPDTVSGQRVFDAMVAAGIDTAQADAIVRAAAEGS